MSLCVPSWDIDETPTPPTLTLRAHSNSNSLAPDVSMLDYEVAELTWENGQLAMHGLGAPRVPNKPPPTSSGTTTKYTWEKTRAGGTLESIVNQATSCPIFKPSIRSGTMNEDLVPWFDHHHRAATASATATMTMDALVPCSTRAKDTATHVMERTNTCMVGSATPVGSCSGANTFDNNSGDRGGGVMKRARVAARVPVAAVEWSSRDNSVSGSVSRQLTTIDTGERELDVCGFTSTSMGSPENTSSAKQCTKATTTTADDHDSVCHSRPQREAGDEEDKRKAARKSSISTKRSRAAAIHNQSERVCFLSLFLTHIHIYIYIYISNIIDHEKRFSKIISKFLSVKRPVDLKAPFGDLFF
ncbi:hypothetical protein ACSBR2_016940 [Camellia fascicularis]